MLIESLEVDLKKPLANLLKNDLLVPASNSELQMWNLEEVDTGTQNKKFTIVGDQRYDVVVVKPDASIIKYFNNTINYLTCIPDFLIFINEKEDHLNTDIVVIDMKSTVADNKQLKSQFRNGKNIAIYLANVTNRKIRYCKFLKSSIFGSTKKRDISTQRDKFTFENGFFVTKSKQLNILDIVRHHKGR